MAKQVNAQVAGGAIKQYRNVADVLELREKLELDKNHSATVNGEPAEDDQELNDYEFVAFAPNVKGGC